ncbi:MAG: hypothetical protein DRJ18_00380 [Candidatus Methanomethylicota archaeon]|nr:MAG: hypothetical protein DRJ18_00380 [Candidatus Verstraetearchaeota archaeon]
MNERGITIGQMVAMLLVVVLGMIGVAAVMGQYMSKAVTAAPAAAAPAPAGKVIAYINHSLSTSSVTVGTVEGTNDTAVISYTLVNTGNGSASITLTPLVLDTGKAEISLAAPTGVTLTQSGNQYTLTLDKMSSVTLSVWIKGKEKGTATGVIYGMATVSGGEAKPSAWSDQFNITVS